MRQTQEGPLKPSPTRDDLAVGDGVSAMDEKTVQFAVSVFAALAHPTRLRIVELLTDQERTVNGVAAALGLLQPNTSQHLAILARAGVVRATREGAAHCYALRGPRIALILRLLDEFRIIHAAVLQEEAATHG